MISMWSSEILDAARNFTGSTTATAAVVVLSLGLFLMVAFASYCRQSSADNARVPFPSFDSIVVAPSAPAKTVKSSGLATFDTVAPASEQDVEKFDAVIVGGGVVGCAMAVALGKQGRRVLMLERDLTEPDRIVGELLQPDGVAKLKALGLDQCLENIDAPKVHGYSLDFKGKSCCVTYPTEQDEATQETFQPFSRGLHHGRFIMQMRRAAAALPTVTVRQGAVGSLIYRDTQVVGVKYDHAAAVHAATIKALHPDTPLSYRMVREDGTLPPAGTPVPPGGASKPLPQNLDYSERSLQVFAPITMVIDGCFSKFRKSLTTPELNNEVKSSFLGVMLHDCKLPYDDYGCVCLTDPTPAVIYPVSSNEIRALISFPGRVPEKQELKEFLHNKFVPQLPECLREAMKVAIEDGHLRSMPNQFMSARPRLVPGAVLIGDSFNMRHPFTGGGMTCGLADAVRLRDILAKVPVGDAGWTDVRALTKAVALFYSNRQHNVAINMLSVALFEVFSSDKPELRQACFDYLGLGPTYFNGPITLLSGRARSQALLARNFSMVALFGVVRTALLPFPTPFKMWTALKMIRQAVSIFAPLVASERAELPLQIVCRVLRIIFMC